MPPKKYIQSWSEIDVRSERYYDKIIDLCKKDRQFDENITFLMVDHCLQTFESHVNSVAKLGKIAGVILKSSTRNEEAERYANNHCKIIDVTKEALKDPQVAIHIVLENTLENEKLVIMDHGGYFSYALKEMMAHPEVSKRLIGIAEVTENGHYKWNQALKETAMPTLSVARSYIKELEDAQTGVAICDATNAVLYSVHSALNSLQSVCILGYGKVGRSIANCCRNRRIPDVTVIELNPLRAQSAMIEGHHVVMGNNSAGKARAFQKAQVIFSATGAKVLSAKDITNLRKLDRTSSDAADKVLFISSCTSPDDEFSEDFFSELEALSLNSNEDRANSEEKMHLSAYKLFDGRQIYILNEGKAVNFAIGGTPGFEICQVWASVLYTAAKLAAQEIPALHTVQALSYEEELAICAVTQEVFFGIDSKDINELKPKAEASSKPLSRRRTLSYPPVSLSPSLFFPQPQTITNSGDDAPKQETISLVK